MKILKSYVFLIIAAASLSACSMMEGLGKDIKKGGEALQKAAE
ncbi:MAG: entericidin A/B family lipoprotein [bacterium]|nr:entericidin A/B family lipoprotein [bacterium]